MLLLSAVGVVVWAGAVAPSAVAASPEPLTGEFLITSFETSGAISAAPAGYGPQISSVRCTASGTSSVTFTASGSADGPYPGTFTASGSATIGPQTSTMPGPVAGAPESSAGALASFTETFTIDSPATETTITGTKTLIAGLGSCEEFSGEAFPLLASLDAFGHEYAFNPESSFTATLKTPAGEFEQTGRTELHADALQAQDAAEPETNGVAQGSFIEFFNEAHAASNGPATVTLSPASVTQAVETLRTVTAMVTNREGTPVPLTSVAFTVVGDVNTSGSCVTNASGQCSFTYRGSSAPGQDTITGCAGANGTPPCGTASTTWVLPTVASVSCSPSSVSIGMPTACTVTVSNVGTSAVTPTGAVSFASNEEGIFAGNPCTLAGSGGSASCSVAYTPSAVGSGRHAITASYGGDSAHEPSSASTAVSVTPATCPGLSLESRFNGTPLAGEDWIWFNGVMKLTDARAGGMVVFTHQRVKFGSTTASVPDAAITISPSATEATTSFNAGKWQTTVPASFGDNIFLSGLSYQLPAAGLPGGVGPVTWQGDMTATTGIRVQWQWAAAAYTRFTSEYNALDVKPTHSTSIDRYRNGDQAGTPENSQYQAHVTGGATGGGGSNYTGSYSGTRECP